MTKLESRIKKIFTGLDNYREDPKSDTVSFEVDHGDISFEKLEKLSKLLETRKINFPDVHHIDGYSGDVFHSVKIEGSEVKFRPLEKRG